MKDSLQKAIAEFFAQEDREYNRIIDGIEKKVQGKWPKEWRLPDEG